ncbi:MAG TPA: rhomboid family intramembrane serine protease [Candidatus Baltobacteraceae bacterium]|jgi:GlpG protein|nr:rhomboid family intramembrane serine protease [Candidatus Baltobacteraceae bacterium]
MRMIGHLKSEASARTFGGYLSSQDIRNMVEPDSEGWAVWIYSEDQIEKGSQALTAYLQNPSDRSFQNAADSAIASEQRQRGEQAAFAKRVRTADQIWRRSDVAPLTLFLIGASVVVTLFAGLNPSLPNVRWLLISEGAPGFLPEVQSGQIWRLITPIFIHFGPTHLIFNMIILYDLGRLIEIAQGTKRLALLVVLIGIGSNVGQYLIGGPFFGGMSGVLYGMVGYIWLRSHSDPSSGLMISPMTLGVMLVWFFLCLFGIIPGVANGTHAVGLVMGMIWGSFPMMKRIFK